MGDSVSIGRLRMVPIDTLPFEGMAGGSRWDPPTAPDNAGRLSRRSR
jgi:hypothetical protein